MHVAEVSTGLAESFRVRSHGRMPFVILDHDGKPLADHDGKMILLASKHEAEPFLRPVERVERFVASGGKDGTISFETDHEI